MHRAGAPQQCNHASQLVTLGVFFLRGVQQRNVVVLHCTLLPCCFTLLSAPYIIFSVFVSPYDPVCAGGIIWSAGRGNEWSHPWRQWDEENKREGGPGRRGGEGGGGDFRRPFKI